MSSDRIAVMKCCRMETDVADRCCLREMSGPFFTRSVSEASRGGKKKMASKNSVHAQVGFRTVQLAKNRNAAAGANRLRRKLSNSFQRESIVRGLRCLPLLFCGLASGTSGNSHFSSCQSPLIQR